MNYWENVRRPLAGERGFTGNEFRQFKKINKSVTLKCEREVKRGKPKLNKWDFSSVIVVFVLLGLDLCVFTTCFFLFYYFTFMSFFKKHFT